ncbi:MAG: hypothetical protein ACYC5G_05000 [Candidatus Doudnabacteria bacterium]
MKKILIGVSTVIVLDQANIGTGKHIYVTLISEEGIPLKSSTDTSLSEIALTYDGTAQKYKTSALIISTLEKPQYIRLYFYSTDADIAEIYYPEDAQLVVNSLTPEAEIVPVQYFIDFVLAASSKLDLDYVDAINNYTADKGGIKSFLKSAQGDLERDLEMYLTPRTLVEKRDNYFERFSMHLWQIQVYYPPIIELVDIKIMYGTAQIANIGKQYFTFDKNTGILEFLPLPGGDTSAIYTLLLNNISAMGISIMRGGNFERIPNMFEVTYTSGLFHLAADPIEKESIRKAVARRAYLDLSPYIDPRQRNASESESIDGVSASKSFRMDKIVDALKADEQKFIQSFQKKYGKGVDMVIV